MNANDSPALLYRSQHYPKGWKNKVPKRIRMTMTVRPDIPIAAWEHNCTHPTHDIEAIQDDEYPCWVNSHGAVAALIGNNTLGVKPHEFEVIEWHE